MITVGMLAKIRRMYFRANVPLREIARRTARFMFEAGPCAQGVLAATAA